MEIIATVRKENEKSELKDLFNKLIDLNISTFRFNFAKAEFSDILMKDLLESFAIVRNISSDVTTILDIPYPGKKIRINSAFTSLDIIKGKKYYLSFGANNEFETQHSNKMIFLNSSELLKKIYKGLHIIYDSGQGIFIVTNIKSNGIIEIVADNSFKLFNMKSISFGYCETYGYFDLLNKLCVKFNPDKIAFSFVNKKEDLKDALLVKNVYGFSIMSKIENEEGIKNLEEIAKVSDEIMLGRGDLCLNADPLKLLLYQYEVLKICKQQNCKVYFATDFLTSLVNNYIPTRSDLIDLQYAMLLKPNGLVLNLDLVNSCGIYRAVELINNCKKIYIGED